MKGYKFIGYVKSTKYNQSDKIYYNPWGGGKFKCIDKTGKERELSKKQQNILYQKFHIRCDMIKIIAMSKTGLACILGTTGLIFSIKYRNILSDLPKITKEYIWDEGILKEEKEIDKLIELCQKYIDKNEEFTEEQKVYLKQAWSRYLKEECENFEWITILNLYNNLSTVDVDYTLYFGGNTVGRYKDSFHKIIILENYKYQNEILFHETIHCFLKDIRIRQMSALDEGFCSALEKEYCNETSLGYKEESEYLLLISEIIGKEKLTYFLENKKDEEFYSYLAECTNESRSNIKELIDLTYERLWYKQNKYYEKAEEIDKEIKRKLAQLAIKADENNKENFIILNALQNKYQLETSFLSDGYTYINGGEKYIIDNENKYLFTCLFDSDYTRAKIKNK